jgi:hypothetical protein
MEMLRPNNREESGDAGLKASYSGTGKFLIVRVREIWDGLRV